MRNQSDTGKSPQRQWICTVACICIFLL